MINKIYQTEQDRKRLGEKVLEAFHKSIPGPWMLYAYPNEVSSSIKRRDRHQSLDTVREGPTAGCI